MEKKFPRQCKKKKAFEELAEEPFAEPGS
jgi:hypothetical protein